MKVIKEIFKYIILFVSLIAMSTFITFVAINTYNKVNSLVIIFSGLWIGIIIMLSLCNILWPEDGIFKHNKK